MAVNVGRSISGGLGAIGVIAMGGIVSLSMAVMLAVPNFFNLILITAARYFVPTAFRAAAFATAPVATTVAPGVLAATITVADVSVVPAIIESRADATMVGGATVALIGSCYTPMFALLAGPVSFASLCATSLIAATGMGFGAATHRAFGTNPGS